MKLEINESYEGELVEDAQKVRDKANWALQTALKAAGVPKCCGGIEKSLLSKDTKRIGEMRVIEDITEALSRMYEHRLDLMRQDLISRIKENDVS